VDFSSQAILPAAERYAGFSFGDSRIFHSPKQVFTGPFPGRRDRKLFYKLFMINTAKAMSVCAAFGAGNSIPGIILFIELQHAGIGAWVHER
jgi:hypothetical protein